MQGRGARRGRPAFQRAVAREARKHGGMGGRLRHRCRGHLCVVGLSSLSPKPRVMVPDRLAFDAQFATNPAYSSVLPCPPGDSPSAQNGRSWHGTSDAQDDQVGVTAPAPKSEGGNHVAPREVPVDSHRILAIHQVRGGVRVIGFAPDHQECTELGRANNRSGRAGNLVR